MADNQSIEAPKEEERETEEEREQIEQEERLQTELQGSLPTVDVASCPSSLVEEFRDQVSQSETLVLPPSLPSSDHDSDCRSIPQLFTGAMAFPVENSTEVLSNGPDLKPMAPTVDGDPTGFPVECPPTSLDLAGFKGQFGMSHQEVLASVTDQAQEQKQLQAGYPSPSLEISPDSLAQSISSSPSKTPQQGLPVVPQDNNVRTPEVDQKNSVQKTKPAHVIVKTPCSDGYNWRKYGQKQTKSSGSYQSYFKCTYSDCDAKKKVERCDNSGRVIEVIYKGRHNHDPPRKIRWTKERRLISSVGPVGGCKSIVDHVKKLEHSDPSTSRREFRQSTLPKSEQKRCSTSSSDGGAGHRAEGEHVEEPEPKRRTKDNTVAYSVPLLKTVKEPKIVVQAAGDVGISGDGYRWRKYGQKMVKGNPYPRSYYKCTSFGCPVRKHVEKATDDTTAVIITYEGKHDHDMPIPKKRHGPPSAALLIAAAAAMNNAQFKKSEALSNQGASTQWSMDVEGELTGEKALELGGEKALESARTLLSIGIELKPY